MELKFCKETSYKSNCITILDKYDYILKSLNFKVSRSSQKINFNIEGLVIPIGGAPNINMINGAKFLRKGEIKVQKKNDTIKICWHVPLGSSIFRAVLIGFLLSLSFYHFNFYSLVDSSIVFLVISIIVLFISIIIIRFRISFINNSK